MATVELQWPGWNDFVVGFNKYVGLTKEDGTASRKAFRDSVEVIFAESPSKFYIRYRKFLTKLYFVYYTIHVKEWSHLQFPELQLQTEVVESDDDVEEEEDLDDGRLRVGQWILANVAKHLGHKRPPFQRAQIMQIKYSEEDGFCSALLVELLDFGMTHWVGLSEVRLLPPSLYPVPRLAKLSTINRIYPLPDHDVTGETEDSWESSVDADRSGSEDDFEYGDEWSEGAKEAFVELIHNSELTIEVINDSICTGVGPAEVDLLLYVDGNRSSVRDLLVFEDHGCLQDPKALLEEDSEEEVWDPAPHLVAKTIDIKTVDLEPGSWLIGRISCVRSPAEIHFQPVKMTGDRECLFKDLESRQAYIFVHIEHLDFTSS